MKPSFLTMTSSRPEGQNDFLAAAALQKLIVAAMKSATEKNPQALAALLHQISNRYNAANAYVRSEVAELMQELKNLVGDFGTSISPQPSVRHVPSRPNSKKRFAAFAFAGFAAVVTISAVAVESVRRSTAIVPSQPASFRSETEINSAVVCSEVNPSQITIPDYTRSDGTPVKSHQRTLPNQTKADNLNCSR